MTSTSTDINISSMPTTDEQDARSKLRESFLKAVIDLNGEPCNIATYEKSSIHATFSGWKADGTDILVRDMVTPYNTKISSAFLRTSDLIAIEFDKVIELSE